MLAETLADTLEQAAKEDYRLALAVAKEQDTSALFSDCLLVEDCLLCPYLEYCTPPGTNK